MLATRKSVPRSEQLRRSWNAATWRRIEVERDVWRNGAAVNSAIAAAHGEGQARLRFMLEALLSTGRRCEAGGPILDHREPGEGAAQ